MAELKIGVNADGSNVARAIDEITRSVNALAKAVAAAGQLKFKPVDVATAAKDLHTLNKQFDLAVARSKSLRDSLKATGQAGKSIHEVDFNKLTVDPHAAQRMRDKAFGYAARGTAWDIGNLASAPALPGPGNPLPSPGARPQRSDRAGGFFSRAGAAFSSGVGGGFGQIANGAIKGAQTGATEGGGVAGGAVGLLRGGLIGAAVFGLFKAGQAVSDGYGMAKERDLGLESLKRQMGDLGVSFAGLRAMSDVASEGLGVNSKEFVQLAGQYNKLGHNAPAQTADRMMAEVRGAVGFSRAYGMDPGQGVGFFGAMKNLDPKQNNRELALQIAEAVNKSGGRAMAGDAMQFVQAMASTVARLSLSTPNTGAYAATYGAMLHGGSSGMTADAAQAILGQADSALSRMGNAGEAGQNFTLGSFSRQGAINPFMAGALASGGLFATRGSTFGADTEIGRYLRNNGIDPERDGTVDDGNRNITNFQSVRDNLDRQFQHQPLQKLDAAKNYFGLQSNQQAAALLNLNPRQASGLGELVKHAGVDINQLNAGGIATIAGIGGAETHGDLDALYAGIKRRTGKDALSTDETKALDAAQGKGFAEFRDALIKIMAGKDQENTEGKEMLAGIKAVESAQTAVGDKLIGPMNAMRDALLKLAGAGGKSATAASLRKAAFDAERSDVDAGYDEQVAGVKQKALGQYNELEARRATLVNPMTGVPYLRGQKREVVMRQIAEVDAQMKGVNGQRDADVATLDKQRAADKTAIDARQQAEKEAGDKLKKAPAVAGRASGDTAPSTVAAGVQGNPNGPIGERNNNPFDLRPWAKDQAQAGGYLKFGDLQTGVDAGFRNLLVAQEGHHRNTIAEIVTPYAPRKDHNNTASYIDRVARMTGYGKDRRLNLHDPIVLKSLGKALLKQENAHHTVTDAQIDRGVQDALGGAPTRISPERAKSDGGRGTQDTLNVNVNVSTSGKNAQGATVQHHLQTSVAVPRGSGAQTVSL